MTPLPEIPVEHFFAAELRVGTVLEARPNEGARVPALALRIGFGPMGERTASAQLTGHYRPEDLVGRQVVALVNVPPRRVAGVRSEVLVLAAVSEEGGTVLLGPERPVPDGARIA